jgi:dTDP-4-amino-4,6-dideoxygalactose transaminase
MRSVKAANRLVRKYGLARASRIAYTHLSLKRWRKWPIYGLPEIWRLGKVLRSRQWGGGWMTSWNPYAIEFAEKFAAYHNARFGICTTNGSAALYIAYKVAGLKWGDEIIVPALTFSATATSALEQGIRPVFVDVDPKTMCIDPDAVRNSITPKTKAIAVVHFGAQIPDMDALLAIGHDHGLPVIEDCAHAHGAKWKGRGVGSLGALGCFSFEATKMMTAGEGGIILTNDENMADRCRSYVNCGRMTRDGDSPHTCLGSNYRISDLQAALLLAQLERLPAQTRRREENIRLFTKLLDDVRGVKTLRPHPNVTTQSGYLYYFRYLSEECCDVPREQFVGDLRELGVPAILDFYIPVYRSEEFGWRDAPIDVDYSDASCPVAEQATSKELVWIPHKVFLGGRRHIERMAKMIREVVESYRGEGNRA